METDAIEYALVGALQRARTRDLLRSDDWHSHCQHRMVCIDLLPMQLPSSFRMAFGSSRIGRISSDPAIFTRKFSMRRIHTVINHVWSIRRRESTTCGLSGSRAVGTLKCEGIL